MRALAPGTGALSSGSGKRSASKSELAGPKSAARNVQSVRKAQRFESLVDELSATRARVSAESVDTEVETWLGKICIALDLDRGGLHEHFSHEKGFRLYKTWVRPGYPPFPPNDDPSWNTKKADAWLFAGKRLIFSHPKEIPAEFPGCQKIYFINLDRRYR